MRVVSVPFGQRRCGECRVWVSFCVVAAHAPKRGKSFRACAVGQAMAAVLGPASVGWVRDMCSWRLVLLSKVLKQKVQEKVGSGVRGSGGSDGVLVAEVGVGVELGIRMPRLPARRRSFAVSGCSR